MKAFLLGAILFVGASAFAEGQPLTTVHTCSIQPGWVNCLGGGVGGWDEGCEVKCTNKRARCIAASGFSPIDPDHGFPTHCEVIPSSCYCK